MNNKTKAPGLSWNRHGKPVWRPGPAAIAAGYPIKTVNLNSLAHDPDSMIARCKMLTEEARRWMIDPDIRPNGRRKTNRKAQGMVYLITSGQHLKIGFTTDLHGRLTHIRTGNPQPIEVLGSFPATIEIEKFLHRMMRAHRSTGEWYELTEAVRRLLAEFLLPMGTRLEHDFNTFSQPRTPPKNRSTNTMT